MSYNVELQAKTYGTTVERIRQMIYDQNQRCAICKIETERLVVDHDHNTGNIRAMLCQRCNIMVGRYENNSGIISEDVLESVENYVIQHSTIQTQLVKFKKPTEHRMEFMKNIRCVKFPAKVSSTNRITIPMNFAQAYGIQQGDNVTVEIELRKESGK